MGPRLQLSRNGKIVGEYDIEKLRIMKDEGRLLDSDHLWMAGWTDWKKAIEYLDAEQVMKEKAEMPKPKRKRAKRRRKKAEPAEATDEDEPEEEEEEEEEETAVENKFTRSLKYIGTLIFILITIAVMLLGHRTTRTSFARNEQRRAAQVKASKEREAQAKPKPAQASAPRPTPAPITQKPKQDYAFTGFGFDGNELFASSVLAYAGVSEDFDDGSEVPPDIATYEGEGWSQLGVALSGVKKGDRFRVTITADRFIKPSRF